MLIFEIALGVAYGVLLLAAAEDATRTDSWAAFEILFAPVTIAGLYFLFF